MTDRVDELRAGLAAVHDRVTTACAAAGRDLDEVRVIVVTKRFPASDVDLLAGLGVTDVGENTEQETRAKYAEVAARPTLTVHFVGRVQSNKAARIATVADVVHSVDRAKLVAGLDRGAEQAGHRLGVLVQVSLDGDPGRGGAPADEVLAVADRVAEAGHLDLRGLMAVAPLAGDPRAAFARLRETSERLRRSHRAAGWISAGMSADLEAAVAEGATHLRVGTAILGSRSSLG